MFVGRDGFLAEELVLANKIFLLVDHEEPVGGALDDGVGNCRRRPQVALAWLSDAFAGPILVIFFLLLGRLSLPHVGDNGMQHAFDMVARIRWAGVNRNDLQAYFSHASRMIGIRADEISYGGRGLT